MSSVFVEHRQIYTLEVNLYLRTKIFWKSLSFEIVKWFATRCIFASCTFGVLSGQKWYYEMHQKPHKICSGLDIWWLDVVHRASFDARNGMVSQIFSSSSGWKSINLDVLNVRTIFREETHARWFQTCAVTCVWCLLYEYTRDWTCHQISASYFEFLFAFQSFRSPNYLQYCINYAGKWY